MSEQNSMVMDIALDQNSVISELAKGAIKVGIESGALARSLATTCTGLKFSILGNVDKGLKVYIAWDSGNPDAVGKAVFAGLAGSSATIHIRQAPLHPPARQDGNFTLFHSLPGL